MLDQVPLEAQDELVPDRVYWVVDPLVNGTFEQGASWMFAQAYDFLFGPILGPQLLDQATQVEELRAGGWTPVA